jgi:hypothetical protein
MPKNRELTEGHDPQLFTAESLAGLYEELDSREQCQFQNMIDWDYANFWQLESADMVYGLYCNLDKAERQRFMEFCDLKRKIDVETKKT